ncbi:hypothetical protein HNR46_002805 [Haloferula luteola]|uniref:Uncharacterized protein n=1 Tax=Haloferula luteola TaxID=595692 RepID=A0A840VFG4_9BACT|nr:hypothetical protein [Haloferula luteola]
MPVPSLLVTTTSDVRQEMTADEVAQQIADLAVR